MSDALAVVDAEVSVAKKVSTSIRLPADIVSMANVVASLQNRSAVDVFDELLRPAIVKLYKQEIAKASKAAEKGEK